jgi:dephospho-CoA kinase
LIVGVTGGVGSGKSTVVRFLAGEGWHVIDVDILAREIIETNHRVLEEIKTAFGKEFINGRHLRARELGRRVFSDPEALKRLNGIVWPVLIPELRERIAGYQKADPSVPVVADMAVLFESECEDLFDVIVAVTSPVKERQKRLMKQRNWTSEEIRQRMAGQVSDAERKKRADYILCNNGREEDLRLKIHDLIQWLGLKGR